MSGTPRDDPPRSTPSALAAPRITWLAPVVDARAGEIAPLFASMAWIFLALTAYYIIKPLRSAVLQTQIGVDNKSIALVATTVFVGLFAWAYGKVVLRVARSRLIVTTFLVFIACLIAFAVLLPVGGALTGYVFFVWVSTFNLMVVSQFWALAADVWSKEEGVRLFGFIGVGSVAGGIFGTLVVAQLAKQLSMAAMLLLSAGVLGACLLLALYLLRFAARRGPRTESPPAASREGPASAGPTSAADIPASSSIGMVLRSPYLRLLAAMMLVLNVVNSNNEWILDKMVSRAHLDADAIKAFYGAYFLSQNVLTFGIQFLLTARVQRRFGARGALLFEPVIGILGGLAFLAVPALGVIRWHKVAENATDYSIQTNTKELLYLPVSKLEKYSAKNFNDVFVVRAGDALAAASIFGATSFLLPALGDLGLKVLVGVDLALGVAWLFIVLRLGALHAQRMSAHGAAPEASS